MSLQPYYEPNAVTPHYELRYGWAGWPTRGTRFPKEMECHLPGPAKSWEEDGLRLLETSFSPECVLMTFSVKPEVPPVLFTARVKGRLQYALAKAGLRVKFSRKVAMQWIGENHREDVEAYIANQIANESWADPRIMEVLAPFTVTNPEVDLSAPTETTSGRYWYNLHLVLVTEERWRNSEVPWLAKIRDQSYAIARRRGMGSRDCRSCRNTFTTRCVGTLSIRRSRLLWRFRTTWRIVWRGVGFGGKPITSRRLESMI